ncbi:MAG: carboxypeptidase regulatory-like domain-containing protein, partial [Nannocystaceae bacterium]
SDAEGAFALWVEPGNVQVAANAQGYAENDASGIAPGHAFELLLTPESILIGKVVAAETGAPLADVDVFSSDFSQRWGGVGPDAVTREDGTFRIDGLDPGSYKPVALNEKTYGAAGATVHLGLGQTSDEVVIEAHPAFAVQGTILTGEQQTCVSGRVSLRDSVNKRTVASRVERDGEVRIHGVLPGTYDVEVSCEGFVSLEHYDAIEVSEPITRQVWEVEAGYAIRGIVVDATGEPVAGTRVMASQTLKEGAPRAKRSRGWGQQTREDGQFELDGLRPGSYEIKLLGGDRASPAEPTEVEIEDEDVENLKIELSGEGIVRGRVIDERGEAVANVTIDLDAVERSGWMSGHSTRSADDGTFALEHVEAGRYRAMAKQGWSVTLRAPGTSDDDVQGVALDVSAGDVTEIELKVEARGASIRGTVVDADGGPVADAFLSATRESDSATKVAGSSMRTSRWGNWWKKPVLTDADGSFELVDLTEGVYTVRAYRKGGGEGFSEGVETDSSCTVAIRATGTLMGRVTLAGGPAPEEFTVTLRDRKAGLNRHESFFRTGGVFRFEELPAGTFELSAAAGKGSARGEATLAEGEEKSGVELDMQATVKVHGKLVDEDSGEPVVGLKVSIRPLGDGGWGGATTAGRKEVSDAQGAFEIESAPSGKVSVSIRPENFLATNDYGYSTIPRTIPSSDAVHELAPIRLIKKRVGEDEARGDAGFRLRERKPDEDWSSRELKVAFVRPGGPAALAGMKVGDIIVKVDGKDVTGDNVYRYYSLVRAPVGTALALESESGETYKIVLEKKL